MEHCYYLHINGDLIYKKVYGEVVAGIRESDFCKSLWFFDQEKRLDAWNILVEALSLGARKERIDELATTWECNDEDAGHYAKEIGIDLGADGNQRTAQLYNFTNLQESACGFGDTYLDAMADLCKQLGFKGGKLNWHSSFKDLIGK